MAKFRQYIDDVSDELLNKVSWPTWKELQESSMIVLVSSVIIAAIVFGMDSGTGWILDTLYKIFQ
jgi:preprotein translocase subunit SecE